MFYLQIIIDKCYKSSLLKSNINCTKSLKINAFKAKLLLDKLTCNK